MAITGNIIDPTAWYYDNDETQYGIDGEKKCGLMYNWYAVDYLEQHKNTLIPGWHVASEEEWDALIDAVGGDLIAALKLKAVEGAVDGIWPESPWYGSDEAGFGALPGGVRYTYGGFVGIGLVVDYWTSRPKGTTYAYGKGLRYNSDVVSIVLDYPNNAHYVRLVKDY